MKRFILFVMCFILLPCSAAYANELKFEPAGGGKFIYCNNPEGIEDDVLLNGDVPVWIMNNENLEPDNYYIYLSHRNYTGNGDRGYSIELDMKMMAKENSKLVIHKAFFETPETYAYYSNGKKIYSETDWGHLQVCADMLGLPMCEIRGDNFYYPEEYETVAIEIEKGESIWLSEYIANYTAVEFGKCVHIQAYIELVSGVMDFNVGALKSDILRERDHLPENIGFGVYRWDYTLKGIADTLPEVETDIEYVITDDTADGEKIPVFLKNQYVPEGHTITEWYTQLNPQNDVWSKTAAAESDILPLYYKDDSKLSFYGSAVDEADKNNVWQFDTIHSAVKAYEPRFNTGEAEYFVPNFILGTDTENHTFACNIGNYGVVTTYRMTVSNSTNKSEYCSLVLTAAGEAIAYETAEDGSRTYAYVKDNTGQKVTDAILTHEIPPGSTEKFEFSLILPVNFNGGIKNELVITDENIQCVNFEEKKLQLEKERELTGYDSVEEINGRYLSDIYESLPDKTAGLISRGGYEYLQGEDSSLVRWCAWDGRADWYFSLWEHVSTVYMLDSGHNVTGTYTFPSLPCEAVYSNGCFYVRTARDGIYKCTDGKSWERTDEAIPEHMGYYDMDNASEWAIPELKKSWQEGLRFPWKASYDYISGITREDFCELAACFLDKGKDFSSMTDEIIFNDTSNPEIYRLASIGVIKGFEDGSFRPSDKLTREQAAVILQRLFSYYTGEAGDLSFEILDENAEKNDESDVSAWAKDGVRAMYALGIIHGVGEGRFDPMGTYSYEQSAATILRLYEKVFNNQ